MNEFGGYCVRSPTKHQKTPDVFMYTKHHHKSIFLDENNYFNANNKNVVNILFHYSADFPLFG